MVCMYNFYSKLHKFVNFRINLFYINFSRQEHQIDVLYVSLNSWDSQVSSYTPFHFSFTVTLSSIFSLKILQEWGVSSFFRNRFELFVNDGKKNQNRKIRFENF